MSEQKINGRTFKVEPILATEALVLQARIAKAIGPGAVHLKEALQGIGAKTQEEATASNGAAVAAIAEIFAKADPEQIAKLVKDIVEIAMIRRDSGQYDRCDLDGDFSDYTGDLYPVMLMVLKEQFGSFFTGIMGNGSLRRKEA